jgi:hypothetical protein
MIPPRLDEGSEREAFEAWAKQYGRIFLDRQPHGPYMHAFTQEAWVGWQARAALSTGRLGGEASNPWADCWYFVMDEAPMEFERIVTTYPPARWHDEAHKLMRTKHPAPAAQSQGESNA